jgi:hypothetical protein
MIFSNYDLPVIGIDIVIGFSNPITITITIPISISAPEGIWHHIPSNISAT